MEAKGIVFNVDFWRTKNKEAKAKIKITKVKSLIFNKHMTSCSPTLVRQRGSCDIIVL